MTVDAFNKLILKIIEEQESIIGPLAVEQAKKVEGLDLDWTDHKITINGDNKLILEQLAKQYETVFGETSLEVCREVVHKMYTLLPQGQIPSLLQ